MTVFKTVGKTKSAFKNQEFFANFNWTNFERGDIVWLENYEGGEGLLYGLIAGIFVGLEDGSPLVRLMTNRHSMVFVYHNLENILDSNNAVYWEYKYLS